MSTSHEFAVYAEKQKEKPWQHLYNPLVINTFAEYVKNGGTLFALSGDLDNLGTFVARYGRPQAENLVDFYSQVSRNVDSKWQSDHADKIQSVAFIPGGEEVLVIASTADISTAEDLLANMKPRVMAICNNQSLHPIKFTSACFGGVVLNEVMDHEINKLVNLVDITDEDYAVYPVYNGIMTRIRELTTREIDKCKFPTIESERSQTLARKIAYVLTLEQKTKLGLIVSLLASIDGKAESVEIGKNFGLDSTEESAIILFLSTLTNA